MVGEVSRVDTAAIESGELTHVGPVVLVDFLLGLLLLVCLVVVVVLVGKVPRILRVEVVLVGRVVSLLVSIVVVGALTVATLVTVAVLRILRDLLVVLQHHVGIVLFVSVVIALLVVSSVSVLVVGVLRHHVLLEILVELLGLLHIVLHLVDLGLGERTVGLTSSTVFTELTVRHDTLLSVSNNGFNVEIKGDDVLSVVAVASPTVVGITAVGRAQAEGGITLSSEHRLEHVVGSQVLVVGLHGVASGVLDGVGGDVESKSFFLHILVPVVVVPVVAIPVTTLSVLLVTIVVVLQHTVGLGFSQVLHLGLELGTALRLLLAKGRNTLGSFDSLLHNIRIASFGANLIEGGRKDNGGGPLHCSFIQSVGKWIVRE